MENITLDYVLSRARRCSSYSQFQQNYYRLYAWAKAAGYLGEIEKILPPMAYKERGRLSAEARRYMPEELLADACKYPTRLAWRKAGEQERRAGQFSKYGAAIKRGVAFMRLCCAHMAPAPRIMPVRYSEAEIAASAAEFAHRNAWKSAEPHLYQAALRRGILDQCCAHMTPAANPYAGDYAIYAYEFADRHVYVGLTMRAGPRQSEHKQDGPVLEHMPVCPEVAYKVVQKDIAAPALVRLAEHAWVERYKAEGWTLLNKAKPGSLGTVKAVKWNKETVCAEVRKFATKQEWIDKSQFTYRLAKKMGWFDEASAHMPKRDARHLIGRVVSAETRARQATAAQRRAADPKWRAAHSAALKGRKLTQAHREAVRLGMQH